MAAKNQSISRGECECKTIANQVKQDIDNLKAWVLMEMEARPLLIRKIAEIVGMRIEDLICKPIQDVVKLCNDHGYNTILPPNELGCNAVAHHCLC